MSLQSLAQLRQSGRSPAALWVVLGKCPDWIKELPDTIYVSGNPAHMDWRPVIGLHVDVFDLGDDGMQLVRTMDAIEAAQPKAIGVAWDEGAIGLSPEHEKAIRAIWRRLDSLA